MNVHDYADTGTCARALADALAAAVAGTLAEKPRATLALSGGRSPEAVLALLASAPVAWDKVDVTLIDERCVAPDHADANAALVRRCFLDMGAGGARFHSLWSGGLSMPDALKDADARLAPVLPADVAYLGMGPDGHIASLFPTSDAAAFESTELAVVEGAAPSPPRQRMSLTLAELLRIPHLFLHVTGAEKRHVLDQAMAHAPTPAVPVSLLVHARPDLEIFACE